MRSSSGEYFIALDHVRALAAFMVCTWHFSHYANGYPVPFNYKPVIFPFALLDEGHTGVALFMTLSGYLFAKLLSGKSIRYGAFFWSRAMRLLPLLAVVLLIGAAIRYVKGQSLSGIAQYLANGFLEPTLLPNGVWSIFVEFHFYLVLPILLWMSRKSRWFPLVVIAGALAYRSYLHSKDGSVQALAYFTIIGRIDQFVFGMLAFHCREYFTRRHVLVVATLIAFALFYSWFDAKGGFINNPSYPSPDPLWIFMPTIEGIAYAIGIAWYDSSFKHSTGPVSRFISRAGEYSYSIYLLHTFVVFDAARLVQERIMDISNLYVAVIWSAVFFVLMMIPGYFSFRYIEKPFLRLRKRYLAVAPAAREMDFAV